MAEILHVKFRQELQGLSAAAALAAVRRDRDEQTGPPRRAVLAGQHRTRFRREDGALLVSVR
jgi:hypothetical protein